MFFVATVILMGVNEYFAIIEQIGVYGFRIPGIALSFLLLLSFYFDGLDSIRWFKKGFAILSDEIEDQILADGGNYERSPMYHCIFLEDLLDLINFSKITLSADADKVIELLSPFIQPMLFWMNVMTHPNGNIPCFNDSANNVTTSPELLMFYI